jgi:hypothetical protein
MVPTHSMVMNVSGKDIHRKHYEPSNVAFIFTCTVALLFMFRHLDDDNVGLPLFIITDNAFTGNV